MIRLRIKAGGQSREFIAGDAAVSFGRAAENDVPVEDSQASRQHCRIEKTPHGWKLIDLESSNGTRVNGELVNARVLKEGDVITIGQFEATFNPPSADEPAAKSAPAPRPAAKAFAPKPAAPRPEGAPVAKAPRAKGSRDPLALVKTGAIAAAVLIAAIVGIKFLLRDDPAKLQHAAIKAASQKAASGDIDGAESDLNALLATALEPSSQKEAKKALEDVKAKIAAREDAERLKREAEMAAEDAQRRAAELQAAFDEATSAADDLVAQENFGAALAVWKQFSADNPESKLADKVSARMKEVLKATQDAWDGVENRANSFTKLEEYGQAAALVGGAIDRFQGTRFYYEAQDKLVAINRLRGVSTTYEGGGSTKLSAGTQDSLLAIRDLVKARRYAEALQSLDRLSGNVSAGEGAGLKAQRADIAAQAALFGKLIDAVNAGFFVKNAIPVGGGTKAALTKATNEALTIEFKDEAGNGGETSKKWAQLDADDMLGYFRSLDLSVDDNLALAAFCYSNNLAFAGAEILNDIIRKDASRQAAAFALVARHRGIPVPEGGFVWYEGGWYTAEELKFAKLEVDAKKAVQLAAMIDPKKALEGWTLFQRTMGDSTATADLKNRTQGLMGNALRGRRTAILKKLQDAKSLVNPAVMAALKAELMERRKAAIKVIFDKKIYPDEDHGKVGQPAVDEAVNKVRELWEHPLEVVGKSNPAITDMLAAADQTTAWLKELGGSSTQAEDTLVARLMAQVNDALSLKNMMDRSMLEKYRAIMSYNERNAEFDEKEKDCIRATNEYRFMLGYQALEAQAQLGRAARKHSEEMVRLGYFAHVGPTKGLATPGERCAAEGYGGGGAENIAMGNTEGVPTFLQWYNSSGHHRNMLGGHTQIGIGRHENHWTENFGAGGPSMKDKTAELPRDKKESVAGGTTGGVTCPEGGR